MYGYSMSSNSRPDQSEQLTFSDETKKPNIFKTSEQINSFQNSSKLTKQASKAQNKLFETLQYFTWMFQHITKESLLPGSDQLDQTSNINAATLQSQLTTAQTLKLGSDRTEKCLSFNVNTAYENRVKQITADVSSLLYLIIYLSNGLTYNLCWD